MMDHTICTSIFKIRALPKAAGSRYQPTEEINQSPSPNCVSHYMHQNCGSGGEGKDEEKKKMATGNNFYYRWFCMPLCIHLKGWSNSTT